MTWEPTEEEVLAWSKTCDQLSLDHPNESLQELRTRVLRAAWAVSPGPGLAKYNERLLGVVRECSRHIDGWGPTIDEAGLRARIAAALATLGGEHAPDPRDEVVELVHKLTDGELEWLEILGRGVDFHLPDFAIEHHQLGTDGSESHERFEGADLLSCLRDALKAREVRGE